MKQSKRRREKKMTDEGKKEGLDSSVGIEAGYWLAAAFLLLHIVQTGSGSTQPI
jgi:hypothetical protein